MSMLRAQMVHNRSTFHSMFQEIDKDGNKRIELNEFVDMCHRLPLLPDQHTPLDNSLIAHVFYAIDTDNNGTVSFVELKTALRLPALEAAAAEDRPVATKGPATPTKLLKGQFTTKKDKPANEDEQQEEEEQQEPDQPMMIKMYDDQVSSGPPS